MSEGRIVGLVGVLLAAIGGVVLLVDKLPRPSGFSVEEFARFAIVLTLAIVAFLGAALMAKIRYAAGGLLAIVGGSATVIAPGGSFSAGVLVLMGGVLGIIAGGLKKR